MKLEAKLDGAGRRRVRGRAPLLIAGATTEHDNNYSVECCKRIYHDLETMLEAQAGGTDSWAGSGGPWPFGAMLIGHEVAVSEGTNKYREIAARFTGVYVEGDKPIDQLEKGDVIGVTFETLTTQAGMDLVSLLTESTFLGGISQRGFELEGEVGPDGIDYVNRMLVEGPYGADFCGKPASPYQRPSMAAVKLESGKTGGSGGTMDWLKELEKNDPAGYAEYQKGQKAIADNRRMAVESAVTGVLDALKPKLESEKILTDGVRKNVIDGFRSIVETEAERVLKTEEGLGPETSRFRNLVLSAVEAKFEAAVKTHKDMAIEIGRSALKNAGVPEGLIAEPDPSVGLKTEGDAWRGGAPNLNTLDISALTLEEDCEMVGLRTGQKNVDGSRLGPRITDVLVSKALGNRQIYVQHPNLESGSKIHVLDLHRPGLRATIAKASQVYETEPFIEHRNGRPSFTDAMLKSEESYRKLTHAIDRRVKLEAGEMTSAATLQTLHPYIRQGVLELYWAVSTFLSLATIWPVQSDNYKIAFKNYKRTGEHIFGTLAYSGSFATGSDEGAMAVAHRAFIKVTTATVTEATFTIAYTDENGDAQSITRVVPTGSAIGDIFEIFPKTGQRIIDITGATVSGWTAGAVTFLGWDALDGGAELTTSGKAQSFIDYITGSVTEYDLECEVSWRAIEDANKSMAVVGPGRMDPAGMTLAEMAKDFAEFGDILGLTDLNNSANFLSTNTLEFDASSAPSGYTLPTWRAELLDYIYQSAAAVQSAGKVAPEWMLHSLADNHKWTWFGEKAGNNQGPRLEAFLNSTSWGRIAGMNALMSPYQNSGRIHMGSPGTVFHAVYIPYQLHGPFEFPSRQKSQAYVARTRAANVFVRPETRGELTITT